MRQEDYNGMMRHPWEQRRTKSKSPTCPCCDEAYCGDGVQFCLECQNDLIVNKQKKQK